MVQDVSVSMISNLCLTKFDIRRCGTIDCLELVQLAAGLCCGLSCLAAGGTIGVIGDAGVRGFGLKAEGGRKWFWGEDNDEGGDFGGSNNAEASNKLYVGMLIMLIFSEALALYGLIVALILSQNNYYCA